jgi:membrane-bound lytic murein transglycosylase F
MKVLATTFLLLPVVFVGCTPLGENALRNLKTDAVGENTANSQGTAFVSSAVRNSQLDNATRMTIQEYGHVIKANAEQYGFDWRLVLAVMKQESGYSPLALSPKGARGLMQLMPHTGGQVAEALGMENLNHPTANIRGGIFYLRQLYNFFDGLEEEERLKLSLAAYNAGIARIYDAQELAAYLHDDPGRWESIKDALPLLSKRYYTLHMNVWEQERPRAGWFGNAGETIHYVENIMRSYDQMKLALN